MKIYGITLEENCPADWAPTKLCFYSPHTFVSNLSVTEGLTKVGDTDRTLLIGKKWKTNESHIKYTYSGGD